MSVRERLCKKLQREIPEINGMRVKWSADRMFPALGWYRTSPHADCYRYSAHCQFEGSPNWWSFDCWSTMTHCLKKSVTLSADMVDREIQADSQ